MAIENFTWWGSALLVINYVVILVYSVYSFFNPDKWFVKSRISIFLIFGLTFLVLGTPIMIQYFLNSDICLSIVALISIGSFMLVIRNEIRDHGMGWMPPMLVYLFSVGQETYFAVNSPPGMETLLELCRWYLFVPFLAIILVIAGAIFRSIFPNAGRKLIPAEGDVSWFALWGVFFALWMIARLVF